MLIADVMRNRKSLAPVESPTSPPTVGQHLLTDDHGGHIVEDENAAGHPTDLRRRRFTAAASIALRKSIDGPQYDENEELSPKRLRSLLKKTSAANVGSAVE